MSAIQTMKGRWIGGLLGWLVWAGALAGETLTIATYNVENYGAVDRMTGTGYRKEYPKGEAEKQALRTVIRGLDADVLLLQEMGPQPYLDELKRDLATEGLDYPETVLLAGDDADRHVALLAKRPVKAVVQHTDLTFRYFELEAVAVKRGLLEVTLATAAGEITLWAVHLKSRYTDRPDDPASAKRRGGEATVIRDRVLAKFPDPRTGRFMILGDFNDVKSSAAVRYMAKRGKTLIAELLPVSDSRGETWTYCFKKEDTYQRVDHILVSPGLMPAVDGGRGMIYDGAGALAASDHRAVKVTLEVGGK